MTEKVGKGLRHFSMKVCEKVRKKRSTSYNEVADELVAEFTNSAMSNSLAEQVCPKVCLNLKRSRISQYSEITIEFKLRNNGVKREFIHLFAVRSEEY